MEKAKKPENELQRLEALRNTSLLDSLPDGDYDAITKLASQICQTPIALFSLVDQDRQWFKSKVGLEASETHRDLAFCAHAILKDDVFVVEDATLDKRFHDNPLVTGQPNVVFYAGTPVHDPATNLPLGTICVIDNKARSLSQQQLESLSILAKQVSRLIELRLKVRELESLNTRLLHVSSAVKNMNEGFVIQDKTGKIVDYNPSALNILELTEDEILGRSSSDPRWKAIKADESHFPGHEHPAMMALSTGLPQIKVKMGLRFSPSKTKWISVSANPIFTPGNPLPTSVVTTFVDVTELQSTQEHLIENARLVSLAEMASGVAHEINNPLSIIVGSHSILNKAVERLGIQDPAVSNHLKKIKDTVFRISKIVRGLQTFARDASKDPNTNINLKEVITDVISISAERFKKAQIDLQIEIPDDIFVNANLVKLGQVVLNLFTNSYDAIENLAEKKIILTAVSDQKITKISLKDSGSGIPKEVLEKIFLPFFTTKPIGKGTGLGLSISKSLIEDMGGRFYYDANESNTTFVIELKTGDAISPPSFGMMAS